MIRIIIVTLLIAITPAFANPTYHLDSIHIESPKLRLDYPAHHISDSIITASNKSNIKEISSLIPGFYLNDYGSSMSGSSYYRGIGNRNTGSGVVFYLDGVPLLSGSDISQSISDISGIYMGMQGHSSSAFGEMHLISANVMDSAISVSANYGSGNSAGVSLATSTKLGSHY